MRKLGGEERKRRERERERERGGGVGWKRKHTSLESGIFPACLSFLFPNFPSPLLRIYNGMLSGDLGAPWGISVDENLV